MLVTAPVLDALRTGFRADYNRGFTGYEPVWSRIATLVPSSTKSNTYGWIKEVPGLREWLGDRVVKSISEGSYAIENRDFELTVGVKRTDIADDNLGIYSPMMAFMGQRASEFPDELVMPMLPAGFSTPCWDGNYFFDDEHPVGDTGRTYSNIQAGAGAPWFLLSTKQPLKPLIYQERQKPNFVAMTDPTDEGVFMRKEFRYGVDLRSNGGFAFPQFAYASRAPLTAANYEALRTAMTSQVGETGRKLNIRPDLIVVDPSNRAAAKQLFDTMLLLGGGNNIYYKDVDVLETPYVAA